MPELFAWLLFSPKDFVPSKRACGNVSCFQLDFVCMLSIVSLAERLSEVWWNIPPQWRFVLQGIGFFPSPCFAPHSSVLLFWGTGYTGAAVAIGQHPAGSDGLQPALC